jgi:hypothetical protein
MFGSGKSILDDPDPKNITRRKFLKFKIPNMAEIVLPLLLVTSCTVEGRNGFIRMKT